MTATKSKEVWYFSTDEIRSSGPYTTQREAWEAARHTPDVARRTGRLYPKGLMVWPLFDGETP